jgi:hypothetical protein
MPKPRIVQALCGPARHAIMAIPYEPGLTAAQTDFGSCDDVTLTESNAADYLRDLVDGLILRRALNPWCGICRAKREAWFFEDCALAFNSLDEALPHLRASAEAQAATAEFLRFSRG